MMMMISIGTKFGFHFKVMRMTIVHFVTVFKIVVKRQIRKVMINFKHENNNKF